MFLGIYDVLNKNLRADNDENLHKLYKMHMETSFKLTHHEKKHIFPRGYTWLREVLIKAPLSFMKQQKKRIIKSIFTHAIYAVVHPKSS